MAKNRHSRLLSVLPTLFAILLATPAIAAERPVDYRAEIRPILSNRCFRCHGPDADERAGGFRLDQKASALAEADSGERPIVPGDRASSELYRRITTTDLDERMPPVESHKNLTAEEIENIGLWIDQGAPWSEHWSHVLPVRHATPDIESTASKNWPSNWIDHFILARLHREGIAPSPEADRVTLCRRLYFDLLGLPPTPEQVRQFVDDNSAGAYERLVDKLLASPHFGERMATHWLDLVRFADTVGYHGDQDHSITPYRDWVIDAINDNMPVDQFTREQLAGDLLADSTIDQKIASGYNRLLQTSHEGGVQPKEYLAMYAADRVRNVSAVWMGATLGCAQCHDHKFDPYTMKDFYSMAAMFADIDESAHLARGTNSVPTDRDPEIEVVSRRQRQALDALENKVVAIRKEIIELATDDIVQRAELYDQFNKLRSERDALRATSHPRRTMITVGIKPRVTRILPRGNWLDESGPIVEPAVPEFLGETGVEGRRANRLDLANWLVDAERGAGALTARVFANRYWYLFFGNGLATVMDDLGGQGEPPSHPELLDRVALELVDNGWDAKQLVKLLVSSQTYRQASLEPSALVERDPGNRLLARQSRYRLPAESVRDTALVISGLLVSDVGGASVKPYQPAGLYRHLNFPTRVYKHHPDNRQWRRGLYMHWQRQFLHPMLKAFDGPRREECTAQRPRSNTPVAALTLLNDPTFIEAARVFAERIQLQQPTGGAQRDADRIDDAYLIAVSRRPDDVEKSELRRLLEFSRQHYAANPEAARALINIGQAPKESALDEVELASWVAVTRAILNLSETITRN
ncbi:MAG: PSD1 and planctomycete cytochrome C domain-containing protein [Pirellulales bacterium]|nr:PSD1 and planctomycete cytochrome C domain-containing protein [Pirellulales bacterium]